MSVVVRRLDHEAVLAALRRYAVEELGPREEVHEVRLVGSLARGDWSARSDADVVVLVDETTEPRGPLRGAEYAPRRSLGVPVDVLVYTPAEVAEASPRLRRELAAGVRLHAR